MSSKVLLQQLLVEKHCCLCYPADERSQEGFRQGRYQVTISIRHAVDRGTSSNQTMLSVYWTECNLAQDVVVLHERAGLEMMFCKLLGSRRTQ